MFKRLVLATKNLIVSISISLFKMSWETAAMNIKPKKKNKNFIVDVYTESLWSWLIMNSLWAKNLDVRKVIRVKNIIIIIDLMLFNNELNSYLIIASNWVETSIPY